MFTIIIIALFCWLFFTAVKLAFRLTFGFVKLAAVILCVLALPALVGGLLFASGAVLLLPVLLVAGACGIIKLCESEG